jgi:[ribosomal protein S5]-alanine N-acetyltransferase
MPPVTLTTARLLLRPLFDFDAFDLFAACSDARLTETTIFETHRTLDDTLAFLRQAIGPNRNPALGTPLAVTRDARLIGCCGFAPVAATTHAVEIGYWIAVPEWGRGYATEAAGRVVDHAFENPDTVRVQARVFVGNAASVRVLEKLGFQHEGTHRAAVFRRGRLVDVMMFARLRGE